MSDAKISGLQICPTTNAQSKLKILEVNLGLTHFVCIYQGSLLGVAQEGFPKSINGQVVGKKQSVVFLRRQRRGKNHFIKTT